MVAERTTGGVAAVAIVLLVLVALFAVLLAWRGTGAAIAEPEFEIRSSLRP